MGRSIKRKPNPRKSKQPGEVYLCFDLGGTKLMAALVGFQGKVITHTLKHIDQTRGIDGLLNDFRELASSLPHSNYRMVSVASAGPLHADRGVLLDPTNFFTDKKSWGVVPLVRHLRKIFKKPVLLENDAAAAVLAEHWKGGHGSSKNLVAITLGTGVGIGVLADGQLVRAGRGLHPEASHIPLNVDAVDYPCGCGANGCIEAYLSGTHFSRRLSARLGVELTGEQIRDRAQQGDPVVLAAFRDYGKHLALAIRALTVTFAPEVVVLSGGFARGWPHFLSITERELPPLLARYRQGIDLLPRVKVSKLGDYAGVLGAAYLAKKKTVADH